MAIPNSIITQLFATDVISIGPEINTSVSALQRVHACSILPSAAFGGINRAGFVWLEIRDAQSTWCAIEEKDMIVGLKATFLLPDRYAGCFMRLRYIPVEWMPAGNGNFQVYQLPN